MSWEYEPWTPVAAPARRHRGALALLVVLALLFAGAGAVLLGMRVVGPARAAFGQLPGLPPAAAAPATPGTSGSAAGPGASGTMSADALAAAVDPAVVDIDTTLGYQHARAAGTGVVLTATGLVLTNNHVIAGATAISATDVGNGRTYRATVVGYDRTDDVALIRLHGASGLRTVTIGNSSTVRTGDFVLAIGNAGGVGGTPSAAGGTVTALDRTITATDESGGQARQLGGLIQVAADVQAGDSGGPLVDASGRVIGIDTAASVGYRYTASTGEGYAIPINQAMAIARQITTGHPSGTVHIGATAMLGVEVGTAVERVGRDTSGAVVAQVLPGSPADRAGLAYGDTVESLDGRAVDSPDTLTALLDAHHPGDHVRLAWIDGYGQQHAATVTLAAGPAG